MSTVEDLAFDLDALITTDTTQYGPIEFSRFFVKVRTLRDQIESTLKPFDTFYEQLAKIRLPEVFDLHKVPSVTLEEGYRITVSHGLRASIRGGVDKQSAYQWLRDNGLGDLVTETVNASTLSAVAKSMAEENRELDGELFNVAVLANTSFNRTKAKD